jgi:very-short-patch-repair endonuclease
MSLITRYTLSQNAKRRCRDLRAHQTKAEKIFWELVRNKRINGKKFYRQYPIYNDILGKETYYIADFYCHECRLLVEIDGPIHDNQIEKDRLRDKVVHLFGIKVLRVKNEEIENDIDQVAKKLEKMLVQP